jgi:hypothetical protein
MTSIQFLAVEFDDIAVWVEEVDLRVARRGVSTKLQLFEVVVGKILAEIFATEPRQRIAIALHTQSKVNVVTVDPFVAPQRRVRPDIDVEFLLSVADLVPEPRILEVGAPEFLQFQHASVKLSCAFQIVNGNQNVMDVECVHGGPSDERFRRQTTYYKEYSIRIL